MVAHAATESGAELLMASKSVLSKDRVFVRWLALVQELMPSATPAGR